MIFMGTVLRVLREIMQQGSDLCQLERQPSGNRQKRDAVVHAGRMREGGRAQKLVIDLVVGSVHMIPDVIVAF